MAIAVKNAQDLRLFGSLMASCLGLYSAALLYGPYRIHRRFSDAIGTDTTDNSSSCDATPTALAGSPLLLALHRVFIAPPPGITATSTRLPSKLSLSLFPALCFACAALLVARSRPNLHTLVKDTEGGRPLDTASLARLQREGKTLLERANLARLLVNVFAVLFLWRMAGLHRQLGKEQQGAAAGAATAEWLRLWFSFSMQMAGLGLVLGLFNLALYGAMQTQYRKLKHAVRHRVRAPTSGLRGPLLDTSG